MLEYKFFEPAFYHTDVPDWGTSYAHVAALGDRALVCLDTGHHAPGTNIEFIVAQLLRLGKLGSFDFNSRFYADDDLIVGAADPFQLFRIMVECVRGGGFGPDSDVALHARPVPQHRGEDPRADPLGAQRAGDDRPGAARRHRRADRGPGAGDVLGANEVFMDAFYTDVRADLAAWREERGLPGEPDAGLRRERLPGTDRSGPRRRHAGRMELNTMSTHRSELIARSNRLGADPKNTNYAGGNTSAKGTETDPVTGEDVELLWVKGSGGDLGTLTESGLAVLRLDRMRALVDVYPGVEREDEMVAAFDYCLHGKGGAAPSIDTAMHGLVDAAHVDHLHPDSGIAIATAADGEQLTKEIFGEKVVWVPWRRPGFQLGLDIAEIKEQNPQAIGCILGGHGITAWGDTSDEVREELAVDHPTPPRRTSRRTRRRSRSVRRVKKGYAALPDAKRRARAAALGAHAPRHRLAGPADGRPLHRRRGRARLPGQPRAPAPGRARHVVPRPLPAHQGQADGRSTCPADAPLEKVKARVAELHEAYRADYAGLLRPARKVKGSPAMRGADPLIILVPGVGMFSLRQGQADRPRRRRVLRQRDQRDARRRGALDVRPDRRVGEVPDRVLGARGGQAPADAEAASRWPPGSRW